MQIADISVLTTRLPAVDRGTLSQAWIEALHLHHDDATHGQLAQKLVGTPGRTASAHITPLRGGAHAPTQTRRERVAERRTTRLIGPHRETSLKIACLRSTQSVTVPKIRARMAESAIIHMPCGERICLLMRGTPGEMIVTVLCSPAMRARVAAAMQHIRGVLASEGKNCRVEFAERAA